MIGGFLGPGDSLEDLEFLAKKSEKELTHFSEEGIADMDIPDHLLEELDFLDNITSCDKVENIIIIIIIIIPNIIFIITIVIIINIFSAPELMP